jgi:hypothetical protein
MTNAAQINSEAKLCHGPEDWDGDQPKVGGAVSSKVGTIFHLSFVNDKWKIWK